MGRSLAAQRRPTQAHPPPYKGGVGRWSVPATWVAGSTSDADLPITNQSVVIAAGTTIYLDCATASIGDLVIDGTLQVDNRDVSLTLRSLRINAGGKFLVGTAAVPFTKTMLVTFTGAPGTKLPRFAMGTLGYTNTAPGSNKGRLSVLYSSANTIAQVVNVNLTSATTFNVVGIVSGLIASGTVGTLYDNGIFFLMLAGSVPFVAGDSFSVPFVQMGFQMANASRNLMVMDYGHVEVFGLSPVNVRTQISDHAPIGTALSTVDSVSDWRAGDTIVVGPDRLPFCTLRHLSTPDSQL